MSKPSDEFDKLNLKLAFQMAAVHTWAASLLPSVFAVMYGFLFIEGFSWLKGILLIIACVLFQSTVNIVNDYFDYKKGTDSKEDNVEASDAVLIYNNINPKSVKILAVSVFAAAVLLCCICAIGSGYVPFVIGVVGAFIIYAYSGGKYPISYLPVGEVVSGFVMGALIPLGIVSCFDSKWHFEILILSIPFVLGIALIMMSNNGCDIEKDMAAKRKTLPAILGRDTTLELYRILLGLWILSAAAVSVIITGLIGIIVCIVVLILGGRNIIKQFKLNLIPKKRVLQMKGINKCNYIINGMILLSLLVGIVAEHFYG